MIQIEVNNSDEFIEKFKKEIMNSAHYYEDGSGPDWLSPYGWRIDEYNDITLNNEDYRYHAWFNIINTDSNTINFGIICSNKFQMTVDLYAKYHSELVYYLLKCFDKDIKTISTSPTFVDNIDIYKKE